MAPEVEVSIVFAQVLIIWWEIVHIVIIAFNISLEVKS